MAVTSHFSLCLMILALAVSVQAFPQQDLSQLCPEESDCPANYDVVFIVDRSSHIEDIELYREGLKNAVDNFDVGHDRTRMGLVLYNHNSVVHTRLDNANNQAFIDAYIMQSLPNLFGSVSLANAFEKTRTQVLTADRGDRPEAPNFCIIFAREAPDASMSQETTTEANLLKSVCTLIVVAAGTPASDLNFFNTLANGKVISTSLPNLPTAVNGISPLVCDNVDNAGCSTLCCKNGGVGENTVNGCCKCSCPDGFSGTFCEDVSATHLIAKYTYDDGNNPLWDIDLTSEDTPDYPRRKTLRRRRNIDPYDRFGAFLAPDPNPVYSVIFKGPGSTNLHYLEGELTTRVQDAAVTIVAFDGTNQVFSRVIDIAHGGPLVGFQLNYMSFRVNFKGFQVTRIEFQFNKPCEVRACYGINDLFGVFTRTVNGDLSCDACPASTPVVQPRLVYGCCDCTPPTPVCDKKLDIALILDRSGSIGNDFHLLKQRAMQIIDRFNLDPDYVRVGALFFNETSEIVFQLDTHATEAQYDAAIMGVEGPCGTTNIAGALEQTLSQILVAPGDRPNVPNACLLITDGQANRDVGGIAAAATALRNSCSLTTVGIGSDIDTTLLTDIATNGNFLHADNIDELEDILDAIIESVCNPAGPPP